MEENDQRKLLRVVGAVMEDGDRVLMAQRPAGKVSPLWHGARDLGSVPE